MREALSAKDAAMTEQLEAKDEEINAMQDEMDEAQVNASVGDGGGDWKQL